MTTDDINGNVEFVDSIGIKTKNIFMSKFKNITISQEEEEEEESPTERHNLIKWWNQEKLKNAKVMVVGAGAIGNETLKNLALLGIGNIFLADFDTISTSNLSRTVLFRKTDVGKRKSEVAAMRTKEMSIYDDVKVNWFHGDVVWELGTGVYREMDIVLGCLDNVETRMAVNKHCWLTNTPWIDSGTQELGLRVEFYLPPNLPCYQCSLTVEQLINANKRYSCDQFKRKSFEEGKIPTTQIASAIVSAIQVQEAIKHLVGQKVLVGKRIYYQGFCNDFDVISMNVKDDCFAHANYPDDKIISLPIRSDILLKDFLQIVSQEQHSKEGATLDFRGDRTFVKSINCRVCNKSIKLMKPSFRIYSDETVCNECESGNQQNEIPNTEAEVPKITQEQFSLDNCEQEMLNMTLRDLGVPYLHIVAVYDKDENYKYYELSGDKEILFPIKKKWVVN